MSDWWDNGPADGPCDGSRPFTTCTGRLRPVGNTMGRSWVLVKYECDEGCGRTAAWEPKALRRAARHAKEEQHLGTRRTR